LSSKNTQAFANPFHEEGCILTHVCGEFASKSILISMYPHFGALGSKITQNFAVTENNNPTFN
jgi:hypothetical protein